MVISDNIPTKVRSEEYFFFERTFNLRSIFSPKRHLQQSTRYNYRRFLLQAAVTSGSRRHRAHLLK